MKQIQTINFATAHPAATSNYSLPLYQGCNYNSTYNCWEINSVNGYFKFNLSLSSKRGVNFIFQLCSSIVNGKSDCPITITANGQILVSNWDPHNSSFYNMGWYAPSSILKSGDNEIIVKLTGGSTKVFLKAATVAMFEMQHQQQTQWCWSGVSTSTSIYYNVASTWTQCTLVNTALRQTTCCANGNTVACNKPWSLDDALSITGNYVSMTSSSEPITTIQSENNNKRPLGARIGWSGGGGHFVMLVGVGTGNMIEVEDPWYGPSYISYTTFKNSYQGSGSWTHSYFTKS